MDVPELLEGIEGGGNKGEGPALAAKAFGQGNFDAIFLRCSSPAAWQVKSSAFVVGFVCSRCTRRPLLWSIQPE